MTDATRRHPAAALAAAERNADSRPVTACPRPCGACGDSAAGCNEVCRVCAAERAAYAEDAR